MVEPTSNVFVSVNDPVNDPALSPLQNITAEPMVALPPAAERLPPAVAFDLVPLPVGSRPLLPGPAASAADGISSALPVIATTTSHERRRANLERRRTKDVCMSVSPREAERLG